MILGGGRGSRLWPLTKYRAKPAVPIAGKFRLIDIPISNCINSGFNRIYVLTQFNSSSLNQHISATYQFDPFNRGFVRLQAASQSDENMDWYQGTSDAVRRNMKDFLQWRPEHILILPGDAVFRMNLGEVLQFHIDQNADVTIALHSTEPKRASDFGIITLDDKDRIQAMHEKPVQKDLPPLAASAAIRQKWGMDEGHPYLASMGIYIFKTSVLQDFLDNPMMNDFGHNIVPSAVETRKVFGYVFNDFWEDIGTIRAFYDMNISITQPDPPFVFFDQTAPIYTRLRFLPAASMLDVRLKDARIASGCRIEQAELESCLIGIRSIIGKNVRMSRTMMMGADYYEHMGPEQTCEPVSDGPPPIGIGDNCTIENAIIDKNARIGRGCSILNREHHHEYDGPNEQYYIRDGVVIIPKHATLEPGTEI